jgi:hypothetical protein
MGPLGVGGHRTVEEEGSDAGGHQGVPDPGGGRPPGNKSACHGEGQCAEGVGRLSQQRSYGTLTVSERSHSPKIKGSLLDREN